MIRLLAFLLGMAGAFAFLYIKEPSYAFWSFCVGVALAIILDEPERGEK